MALTLDIKKDLRYQQGTEERTLEITLEMIKKSFDNELISEITKLSIQEIEAIRMKLKSESKRKQ